MRFLVRASIPTDVANAAIRAGTFVERLQSIIEELHPEAVYFTELEGQRTGIFVINMDDVSQIPAIAEPLFMAMNASVQFHPVMLPEDLMRGADALASAARRYG